MLFHTFIELKPSQMFYMAYETTNVEDVSKQAGPVQLNTKINK
jgi:hypothetical protein